MDHHIDDTGRLVGEIQAEVMAGDTITAPNGRWLVTRSYAGCLDFALLDGTEANQPVPVTKRDLDAWIRAIELAEAEGAWKFGPVLEGMKAARAQTETAPAGTEAVFAGIDFPL